MVGDRGGAIIEMAVTLPLLMFILFFSIDFGRVINEYLSLNQMAYEASRYAASITGLDDQVPAPGLTKIPIASQDFVERMTKILGSYAYKFDPTYDLTHVNFTAEYDTATNEVHVEMHKRVKLLLPIGKLGSGDDNDIPITVRVTGPYLFPGNN